MLCTTKVLASITGVFALILLVVTGCTPPIYSHSIVHKYDAKGNLIGIEETEVITQQSPSTSPMKVRITHKDKLEE
ncbi:MAG: hypothetical protein A2055_01905 [Deltaproteobacteria bacterium GWA2_47_9]|nr:MAG: hypothetical protein A2055_01905 [Deltaproteobacteria bacterium GWA2_47_9]